MTDSRVKRAMQLHRQGLLGYAVRLELVPYLLGTKYLLFPDRTAREEGLPVRLHVPGYVRPSQEKRELEVVERIFASYRAMKKAQRDAPRIYQPAGIWEEKLAGGYSSLSEGLRSDDPGKFHFFLANFGAWEADLGIENTGFLRKNMRTPMTRAYLESVVFSQQLRRWQWFYNRRKPVGALSYPTVGNQAGAFLGGHFVGVGSFFNEIYGSILAGLLGGRDRPVFADLGAGYGKLAYFTLRSLGRFCFLDFDLPETLCLCAYFLMTNWPEKKALLYGEDDYGPAAHGRYDLIFMPSFEIGKAGGDTVDLFTNINSLGEMDREAVTNYVGHIARTTRYFFHMNHDIHSPEVSGEKPGMLASEYPVPADRFRLLFRYLDAGHLLYHGFIDSQSDIFLYLYERTGRAG